MRSLSSRGECAIVCVRVWTGNVLPRTMTSLSLSLSPSYKSGRCYSPKNHASKAATPVKYEKLDATGTIAPFFSKPNAITTDWIGSMESFHSSTTQKCPFVYRMHSHVFCEWHTCTKSNSCIHLSVERAHAPPRILGCCFLVAST
jgi:hypothetical protein